MDFLKKIKMKERKKALIDQSESEDEDGRPKKKDDSGPKVIDFELI